MPLTADSLTSNPSVVAGYCLASLDMFLHSCVCVQASATRPLSHSQALDKNSTIITPSSAPTVSSASLGAGVWLLLPRCLFFSSETWQLPSLEQSWERMQASRPRLKLLVSFSTAHRCLWAALFLHGDMDHCSRHEAPASICSLDSSRFSSCLISSLFFFLNRVSCSPD